MLYLVKFIFGYALMSAAWDMPEFSVIYLFGWLVGLGICCNAASRGIDIIARTIVSMRHPIQK